MTDVMAPARGGALRAGGPDGQQETPYDPAQPFAQLVIVRDGIKANAGVEVEFAQIALRDGLIVVSPMLPFYGGARDPAAKQLGLWVLAADPDWLRDKLTMFDNASNKTAA